MTLLATLIGETAQSILDANSCGTVVGVFHKGWYLGFGQDVLLIHDEAYGYVPHGIGVNELPYRKEFEGMYFSCEGKTIRIKDVIIDISGAKPYLSIADRLGKDAVDSFLAYAAQLLEHSSKGEAYPLLAYKEDILAGRVPEHYSGMSAYTPFMLKALASFFASLNSGGVGMREALEKMIGLGIGLTPTMDDWLNGFVYASSRLPIAGSQEKALEGICALLREPELLGRTNSISSMYLKVSSRGESTCLFDKALFRIATDVRLEIADIGSSSGIDVLTGMIFACCYYRKTCDQVLN